MISIKYWLVACCLLCISSYCTAQTLDSLSSDIQNIPGKFYTKIQKKYSSIDKDLSKKSARYLKKMERQENRINSKLNRFDSTQRALSAEVADKYTGFIKDLSKKSKSISNVDLHQYNSYTDTLTTSLSFLKKISGSSSKAVLPLATLNELKDKFNQSEKIKDFISERKKQIKEVLSKYTKVPASVRKEYDKLNKTAYYYKAQVNEYKNMLKEPKKIEETAIRILNKIPVFQKFMQKNSQLASLFRLPDNNGGNTAQSLAGLQTRASVQGLIQQRIAADGPNAMAQVQQNLAAAHTEMNKLKDKINQFGGGGSDVEIPDFKPNTQKTKPFLKRLEYGFDVQFAKSSSLLPNSANLALSLGYKPDDKKSIGLGMSYNLGMGTIQHLSFTSLGLGFRSYLDWKIKKQFYLSGGYEMNYNLAFKNIEQLKNYDAWQSSTLVGLSKKYKISKKVKGEMKVLYDFLANAHVPVSQPVVFRLGYKL